MRSRTRSGDGAAPDRPVGSLHPDIRERELARKQDQMGKSESRIPAIMRMLGRVSDTCREASSVALVGCGPCPDALMDLIDLGYRAVGVEPVGEYARAAANYVGHNAIVLKGSAEQLPLADGSQVAVILESVLEHVDSVPKSLSEAHRVLVPGGMVYIKTTNRLMLTNGEFTSRLYQWYPRLVKESFVYRHLHHDPRLARYTSRPAVHWFTFSELCDLGRDSGFAAFYSALDLLEPNDPEVARYPFVASILTACSRSAWLRSLALTQQPGSIIVMERRRAP